MGTNFACCASSETDQALRITLDKEKEKYDDYQPVFRQQSLEAVHWEQDQELDFTEARYEIEQLCETLNPLEIDES